MDTCLFKRAPVAHDFRVSAHKISGFVSDPKHKLPVGLEPANRGGLALFIKQQMDALMSTLPVAPDVTELNDVLSKPVSSDRGIIADVESLMRTMPEASDSIPAALVLSAAAGALLAQH